MKNQLHVRYIDWPDWERNITVFTCINRTVSLERENTYKKIIYRTALKFTALYTCRCATGRNKYDRVWICQYKIQSAESKVDYNTYVFKYEVWSKFAPSFMNQEYQNKNTKYDKTSRDFQWYHHDQNRNHQNRIMNLSFSGINFPSPNKNKFLQYSFWIREQFKENRHVSRTKDLNISADNDE